MQLRASALRAPRLSEALDNASHAGAPARVRRRGRSGVLAHATVRATPRGWRVVATALSRLSREGFDTGSDGQACGKDQAEARTAEEFCGSVCSMTSTIRDDVEAGCASGDVLGLAASVAPTLAGVAAGVDVAEAGASRLVGGSFGKLGTVVENPGLILRGFTTHGFKAAETRGLSWDLMESTVQSPTAVLRQSAGQYISTCPTKRQWCSTLGVRS
jgi:hypothetical protein